MDYTVVWNGSFKTYLCIPTLSPRDLSYVKPATRPPPVLYQSRERERLLILKALAARAEWYTPELREVCGLDRGTFNGILNRLAARGVVTRPRFQVVALRVKA